MLWICGFRFCVLCMCVLQRVFGIYNTVIVSDKLTLSLSSKDPQCHGLYLSLEL